MTMAARLGSSGLPKSLVSRRVFNANPEVRKVLLDLKKRIVRSLWLVDFLGGKV